MKTKPIAILIAAFFLLALPAPVLAAGLNGTQDGAEHGIVTELALCCTQEVESVDCVYSISGTGTISSLELKVSDCLYDWNVKDGKLYLSIATSGIIAKCRTLAEVTSLGEITLTPISLLLNGETADISHLHHGERIPIPELTPTCDKPGSTGGATCSICGAVLEENTVLPALGPSVAAILSSDGTLTINAVLSDDAATENTILLAVYSNGRMLCCKNISTLTQNDLHLTLSGVRNADTVKIFRLDSMEACNPLRAAIEVAVTPEA